MTSSLFKFDKFANDYYTNITNLQKNSGADFYSYKRKQALIYENLREIKSLIDDGIIVYNSINNSKRHHNAVRNNNPVGNNLRSNRVGGKKTLKKKITSTKPIRCIAKTLEGKRCKHLTKHGKKCGHHK